MTANDHVVFAHRQAVTQTQRYVVGRRSICAIGNHIFTVESRRCIQVPRNNWRCIDWCVLLSDVLRSHYRTVPSSN